MTTENGRLAMLVIQIKSLMYVHYSSADKWTRALFPTTIHTVPRVRVVVLSGYGSRVRYKVAHGVGTEQKVWQFHVHSLFPVYLRKALHEH